MTKHEINKTYLKGCEQMLRENRGKFVIMLAITPEKGVDCMKNVHNVTEEELRYVLKFFLVKYKEYKNDLSDEILKDLGL